MLNNKTQIKLIKKCYFYRSHGLATGNWRLATGHRQLATGDWQLATGNWRLAIGNWHKKKKIKF